ncbi:hypothetical protein C943_00449 [Mariniradius saccharolyticus AK6]|uniref:Uncharacterized protein n=1 Tax=Mariniradius saccharolyticus AK6 TaxID=1239962 RepID=M7XXD9_9BACT|nr:hypothetical protein [Mariniradius saccharolyticus]EMS33172.1 hypothetical protein C943_00449 [Mariniradius saccharolyticus AK6]
MTISTSDTALALRISQALQEYFDRERIVGPLRSNEVYEILVRKGLIERDRHQGIKFRDFLHRLRKENQLYLIPQCRFEETRGDSVNWFFESTPGKVPTGRKLVPLAKAVQKKTLDLEAIRQEVEKLPKRDTSGFGVVELETRKNYPRAYEYWTQKEEELLQKVYSEIQDPMELSRLFKRQPSAIENRLGKLILGG